MVKVIHCPAGSVPRVYARSDRTAYPTHWLTEALCPRWEATPVLFASEEEARRYMAERWGFGGHLPANLSFVRA